MTDHIDTSHRSAYYLYSLLCRACGYKGERRLEQFAEIPNCPNCDGQLLVDNATLEKEIEK